MPRSAGHRVGGVSKKDPANRLGKFLRVAKHLHRISQKVSRLSRERAAIFPSVQKPTDLRTGRCRFSDDFLDLLRRQIIWRGVNHGRVAVFLTMRGVRGHDLQATRIHLRHAIRKSLISPLRISGAKTQGPKSPRQKLPKISRRQSFRLGNSSSSLQQNDPLGETLTIFSKS